MSGVSELHVAAMPFPAFQGTQAAVRMFCEARSRTGGSELLTYGGERRPSEMAFPWHRTDLSRPLPAKSGPSARKLMADWGLVRTLDRLLRHRRFDRVVAHHVEAAMAAVLVGVQRLVFVAHTSVGIELPSYASPILRHALEVSGHRLDRFLLRRCEVAAAVSPRLSARLSDVAGRHVSYLPIPWNCAIAVSQEERAAARRVLGIDGLVVLYSGNLDAYQGVECLVEAIARVGRPVTFLVHTAANPASLHPLARQYGIGSRVRIVEMTGAVSRRLVAAAATLAVVPRRVEGGAPVKLLDALSRGIPTVVMNRGTGGLRVDGAAEVVADRVEPLARGIERVLMDKPYQEELGRAGPRYIRAMHAPELVSERFDAICSGP